MDALARREELRAALGLAESDGVGAVRFRRLVDRFGSARAAIARGPAAARSGALPADLRAVADARTADAERLDALAEEGIRLVAYGAEGYPDRLGHLHRPPPVLYLAGDGALPDGEAVAVVGTRKATGYGRRMARDLAGGLARAGWAVVSGMAAGVDGVAHRAALDAGGPTVGVLGSGLRHEYPASNRDLYRDMRTEGLLATEFPPEVRPEPAFFPRRNRIIAALADAVLVVQAGRRSGALITVEHGLELGREAFAVPGPVGPPASEGVHEMLREGATPATSAGDVLEALGAGLSDGERGTDGGSTPGRRRGDDGDGPRMPGRDRLATMFGPEADRAEAMCRALAAGPRHADELADEAGLDAGAAAAVLGRLELEGWVRGLPGGRFEAARR